MIAAVGIDLVSVEQTERLLIRFGERFTRRVYTETEREYCESRRAAAASYAARFAAKEAAMKALAAGWGSGLRFREIEVTREAAGRPALRLAGEARRRAEALGVKGVHLSLSHEKGFATAVVIMEK